MVFNLPEETQLTKMDTITMICANVKEKSESPEKYSKSERHVGLDGAVVGMCGACVFRNLRQLKTLSGATNNCLELMLLAKWTEKQHTFHDMED